MRVTILAALAVMAMGCRTRLDPVPVAGVHTEVERLIGDWSGDYASSESRRSGTIFFQITAHGDSAYGDVLMPVAAGDVGPRPVDLLTGHEQHVRSTELLSIKFVRVAGGAVQGELEPYIAPDCDCVARTIFYGKVEGTEISGTYLTTTDRGTQRGEWRVHRVTH
jgi:hypothetical protein